MTSKPGAEPTKASAGPGANSGAPDPGQSSANTLMLENVRSPRFPKVYSRDTNATW